MHEDAKANTSNHTTNGPAMPFFINLSWVRFCVIPTIVSTPYLFK